MPIELEWISKDGSTYTAFADETFREARMANFRLSGMTPDAGDQIGISTFLADVQKKIGKPVYNYKKIAHNVTIELKE